MQFFGESDKNYGMLTPLIREPQRKWMKKNALISINFPY